MQSKKLAAKKINRENKKIIQGINICQQPKSWTAA
jgi:hypothetical protein